MQFFLKDSEETESFGMALFRALPSKCLVFFYGNLGAGKTSLVRGMLRASGYQGTVRSPTYSLVEEYALDGRRIYHFDLYRLKDPEELEWMGIDDYLSDNAMCCIEWPQMGLGFLSQADIEVYLETVGDGRAVQIKVLREDLKNTLKLLWENKDILI